MATLTIKLPGLLSTIQDSGRFQHQQSGVCVSGVMDSFAHRTANLLVGNPDQIGVIEMTMMGPELHFDEDALIAITGADLSPTLEGLPVRNWESIRVKAGSTLRFGAAKTGVRAYLAIAGGFDIPMIMGSQSTYIKAQIGGLEGRAFRQGDTIGFQRFDLGSQPCRRIPKSYLPRYRKESVVRVVMGPQDDFFTEEGIRTFLHSEYKVGQSFDRMGYRLEGAKIQHKDSADIISDGMVMGAVQVPGGGEPIILMADRQTTGGYTKIAAIVSVDLPIIGQAKGGDVFRFQKVSMEQAQDLFVENERKLRRIREELIELAEPAAPVPAPAAPAPACAGGRQYQVWVNGSPYHVHIEEKPL